MHRTRRLVASATALTLLAGGTSAAAPASAALGSSVGSAGAGEPYFPRQGNGGYDVRHYDLRLRYTRVGQRLAGTATIRARAHQRLTRFDLDLRRTMHVSAVRVDGRAARWAQPRSGHELVITPRTPLASGRPFTVAVTYAGVARSVTDPDGSPDGWIRTADGAFVANEPQGTPSWYPVNDSLRDKATYAVSVDTPAGTAAVSNGRFVARVRKGPRTLWRWRMTKPISSYLVTATVGKFRLHRGRTPAGVPYVVAVDPTQRSGTAMVLAKLPAIVDFYTRRYGAYPFGQAGAIIDNAPNVGYALETATRPLFPSTPDELTLAHELSHQWYGDTVTARRWRDIWINEGFAEFSTWMWDQHRGGTTMRQHLRDLLSKPANDPVWTPPPGNPGSAPQIFADSVYQRGAGTLEALRERLGNPVFFRIMRGWLHEHPYGSATTFGFTVYAASVAHRDLRGFFHRWLYRSGKP